MKNLVLFILLILHLTNSRNPGFKSTITTRGIRYASTVGIDLLKRELARINIPTITQKVSTPVGNVEITLSEIKIQTIELPRHDVLLNEERNSGHIRIQDASINLNFRWRYKYAFISDSGSGTVSTTKNNIFADVTPFIKDGRPQVIVNNVAFQIGDFKISLRGGASWLYEVLLKLFKDKVKSEIEKAVRNNAGEIINKELNNLLMKLPTNVKIPSNLLDLGVDWSILRTRIFSHHFTLEHVGQFFTYSNRRSTQLPSHPTPFITQNDKMLEIIINEYFGKTIGEALHQQGFFNLEITDALLPPDAPVRLNTNAFRLIVPGLHRAHPDKNLILKVKTLERPDGKVTKENGINIVAPVHIEWHVEKDGKVELAFVLKTIATLQGIASINDNKLQGRLTVLHLNSEIISSNIGDINIGTFNNLINVLFVRGLLPIINNLLNTGVALPSVPGLHLLDPSFVYNDGYVSVSLNVRYDVFETNKIVDEIVSLIN